MSTGASAHTPLWKPFQTSGVNKKSVLVIFLMLWPEKELKRGRAHFGLEFRRDAGHPGGGGDRRDSRSVGSWPHRLCSLRAKWGRTTKPQDLYPSDSLLARTFLRFHSPSQRAFSWGTEFKHMSLRETLHVQTSVVFPNSRGSSSSSCGAYLRLLHFLVDLKARVYIVFSTAGT